MDHASHGEDRGRAATGTQGSSRPVTAAEIVAELCACGISHVIYLPGSAMPGLREAVEHEPTLTLVPVCREGEALGIATGLVVGGKSPVVVHPSAGLFESGDSIRGFGLDLGLPVLLLIDYRERLPSGISNSSSVFVEPVLRAWGIRSYTVRTGDAVSLIARGAAEARERRQPVAILFPRDLGEP